MIQLTFENGLDAKINSFHMISLLMKGFLWKEAPASESRLGDWLSAVDKVKVKDWGKWADLTTEVVLKVVMKDFCSTLERGLTESERHFLVAAVRGFVDVYGKSGLEVLKF